MTIITAAVLKQPHGFLLPIAFTCTIAAFAGAVFSAVVAMLAPQESEVSK
jgi:hypothetical protein